VGLRQDGFYFDDLVFEVIGENYASSTNVEHSIMTISPNPSNDFVRVSMNPQQFKKNLTYAIYNISGQKIETGSVDKPQMAIDISQYDHGSYVMQIVEAGKRISSTNFIKQ